MMRAGEGTSDMDSDMQSLRRFGDGEGSMISDNMSEI